EPARRAVSRIQRGRARVDARAHGAFAATRARAWPWMHTAQRAVRNIDRASSDAETRHVQLTLSLNDQLEIGAATVVVDSLCDILRARDARVVDLQDHIALLQAGLIRDRGADAID